MVWIGRLSLQIKFMPVSDNEYRTFKFAENYTTVRYDIFIGMHYVCGREERKESDGYLKVCLKSKA